MLMFGLCCNSNGHEETRAAMDYLNNTKSMPLRLGKLKIGDKSNNSIYCVIVPLINYHLLVN